MQGGKQCALGDGCPALRTVFGAGASGHTGIIVLERTSHPDRRATNGDGPGKPPAAMRQLAAVQPSARKPGRKHVSWWQASCSRSIGAWAVGPAFGARNAKTRWRW